MPTSPPPRGTFRVLAQIAIADFDSDCILADMEHGSLTDNSHASFSLSEEDHTLANAVRFVLNQDPRVTVAAYSIPHPSLPRVNIRVQTTGDPAREVLKDACQELMLMNRHVRSVVDKAVEEFQQQNQTDSMNIDTK